MECVREAIAGSRAFMSASDFDPWVDICGMERTAFVERYMQLFVAHLARKKEIAYHLLCSANKHSRQSQSASDAESSTTSCAGSASGSFVGGSSSSAFCQAKGEVAACLSTFLVPKKARRMWGRSLEVRREGTL